MALFYFLLVYNARHGRLQRLDEYVHEDLAMRDFARLEEEFRGDLDIHVLLLMADSVETLKKTHPHYFAEADAVSPLAAL